MIKIIITITTLLLTILCSAQTVAKEAYVNLSGRNCLSRGGVCDITTDTTTANKINMKAVNTYKQSENTMVIEVDANNLSTEDQMKFFGKEYSKMSPNETLSFIQQDDYVFGIDSLIYLGFDVSYKNLKKGTYPLVIVKDKILITLTLSKD